MNEVQAEEWRKRFPYLKETWIRQRGRGSPAEGTFFPVSRTPHPNDLLKIMPSSLGERLLKSRLEIMPTKRMAGTASGTEGNVIGLSTLGVHDFFHEIGHFIWINELTPARKKEYAKLVGAHNARRLFGKEPRDRHNDTEEHFARNVQNVLMLRKLEKASGPAKASELLQFMKKIGVIDDEHVRHFYANAGAPFTFHAGSMEKVSEADGENGVFYREARKVRQLIEERQRLRAAERLR